MARTKADTVKRETIACTVPAGLSEFIEDYRWQNRMSRSEVVASVLTDWATANGYAPGHPEKPAGK